MGRPTTRAASRAAGLLPSSLAKAEDPSSAEKRILKAPEISSPLKNNVHHEAATSPATKKKSHAAKVPKAKPVRPPNDELPHNLGRMPSLLPQSEIIAIIVTPPDTNSQSAPAEKSADDEVTIESNKAPDKSPGNTASKTTSAKKSKGVGPYHLTPGESPYPDWPYPTAAQCEKVNTILSEQHGYFFPPKDIPEPSLTVTGCGEVPSVLDALIRTLLSGATTSSNSAMAFAGLIQRFGILQSGIGKGSVDWDAVRQASVKDVEEAIKRGGLAERKSKHLKAILDTVYEENRQRRSFHMSDRPKISDDETIKMLPEKVEKDKQFEIACADEHFLSLNHLHNLATDDVMTELTKFPGIGPKTAACVILFCLQRPCFAVDTHIFRLCKWLGWLPQKPVPNEVTAFKHLEVRVPDELKYSLHQLFIQHGKNCPRCRAKFEKNNEECVIEHLVKRPGVPDVLKRKKAESDEDYDSATTASKKKKLKKRKDAADEKVAISKMDDLTVFNYLRNKK